MPRERVSALDRARGERLGAYLREARLRRDCSAQDVAEASKLSIDTVRSIETGRTTAPSFQTVVRIADCLELGLDDIREAIA